MATETQIIRYISKLVQNTVQCNGFAPLWKCIYYPFCLIKSSLLPTFRSAALLHVVLAVPLEPLAVTVQDRHAVPVIPRHPPPIRTTVDFSSLNKCHGFLFWQNSGSGCLCVWNDVYSILHTSVKISRPEADTVTCDTRLQACRRQLSPFVIPSQPADASHLYELMTHTMASSHHP